MTYIVPGCSVDFISQVHDWQTFIPSASSTVLRGHQSQGGGKPEEPLHIAQLTIQITVLQRLVKARQIGDGHSYTKLFSPESHGTQKPNTGQSSRKLPAWELPYNQLIPSFVHISPSTRHAQKRHCILLSCPRMHVSDGEAHCVDDARGEPGKPMHDKSPIC